MRHITNTIRFSQGWLRNELEKAVEGQTTEQGQVIAAQVMAQFIVLDEAIDDLLQERSAMQKALDTVRGALV